MTKLDYERPVDDGTVPVPYYTGLGAERDAEEAEEGETTAASTTSEMLRVADLYKALREKKQYIDNQLKDINSDLEEVQKQLIDIMVANEVPSFTYNGSGYSLVIKEYINPVAENKAELYDRMKEQGFEHLFTINSNTLSATVKELKSNNDDALPEWLQGLVSIYEKASISLRAKK